MKVPDNPKLFHILHIDRLSSVMQYGGLVSDSAMRNSNFTVMSHADIGMPHIKERRMKIPVGVPENGYVGECVPFYFTPRSIMLYIHNRGGHNEVSYRGGQEPIIHLVFSVDRVIEWARKQNLLWAFTNTNAGAGYAQFFFERDEVKRLRWDIIALYDFTSQEVKDAKQSEFLVRDMVAWELIDSIVVINEEIKRQVESIIKNANHKPLVEVNRKWYY